jgi:hypothetical protein
MRNRLIGIVGIMALASTMATAACSSNSNGTAATTGGSASTGGQSGGGNGAATGGSFSGPVTNLDSSKALNALTSAEVTQLCNDTYKYFADAIPGATTCKWKGVLFATQSSAPTQEALVQNCKNQQTPCQPNPAGVYATPMCSEPPSDCAGTTVAQYSTCVKDMCAAFIQDVATVPDCDAFTSAYWTPVWDIVAKYSNNPAPSCNNLCAGGFLPPSPAQP